MEKEGVINVESKIVKDLKGKLTEAYKTIAEKEAEVQRLLEKNAVLEKRLQREVEVKASPILLERKAEEIVPKECWGILFRNLNAEDLLSCRQVCKTFNQLLDLKEFKETWKFHLILPLLFPYFKTSSSHFETWKHLYNIRLVCRSWRHSIDKYVSDMYGKSYFPRPREMPLLTRFDSSEDIEEFQEKFGECNTNPFPSKCVLISNPDEDDEVGDEGYTRDYYSAQKRLQKAFVRKAGKLLKQFGKHVFRLRLTFEHQQEQIFGPDPLTLCKLIKRIRIHVPNLKELKIDLIRNFVLEDGEDNKVESEEEEVASYIAENALALPNLQALSISDLDKKVEDYLLDALGSQVIRFETHFENLSSQFHLRRLKNVRKLWLHLYKPKDTLECLRFLQSPLEFLNLSCTFEYAQETWNVDKVLGNLKHLPIELLEIYLSSLVPVAEAGIDLGEYNNASIKTLIIKIDLYADDQISFNFLQALTKLENLELKFSGEQGPTTHPGELPEVVKLNEYLFGENATDLPYHSNVWEKVPSLKTLTLAREVDGVKSVKSIFTREKHERIRIIAEGDGPDRLNCISNSVNT